MNAEIFAEWMRRQGHHVIRTKSSFWYDAGTRVLQAFPYHWIIQPSKQELRELMFKHGILTLRYSAPLESAEGIVSYHITLDPPYSMDMLTTKVRNRLRKGLRECLVEKIPLKMLATEGWKLQRNTLERQGRLDSMHQAEWEKMCIAADGLDGFEAWGAFVDDQLAASILMCCIDNIYYILFAQSHSDYLKLYVNNALFYTASCDALARKGAAGIFGALHSLDAPESVSEFKLRLGFSAKPVRQRVVFHPWAAPFSNSMTHTVIAKLQKLKPNKYILDKAEGMLRFYLQGQLPVTEQEWPGCLAPQKYKLLRKINQYNG